MNCPGETFTVSSAAKYSPSLSIHILSMSQTLTSTIFWQKSDFLEHTDHTDGQKRNGYCSSSLEDSVDIFQIHCNRCESRLLSSVKEHEPPLKLTLGQ